MNLRLTFFSLMFASFTSLAQTPSYPQIRIYSDSKAPLSYFQAVEQILKSDSHALQYCHQRTMGNGEDNYRYKVFRFSGIISETGTLSLGQDTASKESNESWSRMPYKYRNTDQCIRQRLSRLTFPRNENAIDLLISIEY